MKGKALHQQGIVAKAQFKAVDNPYTGIFQGADNAIIRLSDANIYVEGEDGTPVQDMKPSIAVKFLRDTKPAADYLGMVSGESGQDFFANNFSNHISAIEDTCINETVGLFYS